MARRRPNLFRVGQRVRCSITGKEFVIRRVDTNVGVRYLLVSLISGNPGSLKSAAFLNLQIEDKQLEIL
jgi:hypothetical protein